MHSLAVVKTFGVMLLLFSFTLLPPIAVSLFYGDGEIGHLSVSWSLSLALGSLLWLPVRKSTVALRHRDAFVVVALLWTTLVLLGATPFVMGLGTSFTDAVFESVSGFTTTGATVLAGLDEMAPSLLFYRQEIQWLGGIGVIVSAVALLPMLGVGGMQLYRAETPGPMKRDKISPRIAVAAQRLWHLYAALTLACAVLFWWAGMTPFDAIAHSLATISTGGFSTHDASLAYFDSRAIENIAMVFMLLGAINFALHFVAWRQFSLQVYWQNSEARVFLFTVLVATLLSGYLLWSGNVYEDFARALQSAAFEVVSVITSTGFGIADFAHWPSMLPALLVILSIVGGCAGSTAGGVKMIRVVLVLKHISRELHRLIHPQQNQTMRFDERIVTSDVTEAVWGFIAVYFVTYAIVMLLLIHDGMDHVSAFGAVAACLNNLGPGLGEFNSSFAAASDFAKWLLSITMLLGRLEIFTFLVLLTPGFWRG